MKMVALLSLTDLSFTLQPCNVAAKKKTNGSVMCLLHTN